MLIDIETFRLRRDANEGDFLVADKRVQEEVAPHQAGFVRRTTARTDDGWMVVTFWYDADHADRAADATTSHPAVVAFDALIDNATRTTQRATTLD